MIIWIRSTVVLFHNGGSYHIEISPLICRANQWADFYKDRRHERVNINMLEMISINTTNKFIQKIKDLA